MFAARDDGATRRESAMMRASGTASDRMNVPTVFDALHAKVSQLTSWCPVSNVIPMLSR